MRLSGTVAGKQKTMVLIHILPPLLLPHPPNRFIIDSHWHLEVAAVAPPEAKNETFEDQFSNLRELGVDDGHDSSVDMSEDGRRCLSLKH